MMNNNQPFITIGIASYNYSKYLQRAFDAICKQSFTDFEVLYCDDGSTDDSCEIIERFIKENPSMNIRLIRGENIGVSGNKNRILDNARGKYVMLCDADDWMDDNCLEVLAEAAVKEDSDRVVSCVRNVNPDGETLKVQYFGASPCKWAEVLHHGAIYKREVITTHNIKIFDKFPDDFGFAEEFNIYAKNTTFVNKAVYNWDIHMDSTGNSNSEQKLWHGGGSWTQLLEK